MSWMLQLRNVMNSALISAVPIIPRSLQSGCMQLRSCTACYIVSVIAVADLA